MKISSSIRKVGIVGTGVAGLAAARLLSAAGYQCQLFEKGDKVGGVWTVGYHTFGLQTRYSLYEIPDFPMPDHYPDIPSGEQLQAYFESYAKHFGLLEKIQFGVAITKLEETENNTWLLHYKNLKTGESDRQAFDFIVVATGLYSNPFLPDIPRQNKFRGTILHSSEYMDPDVIKGNETVVVGFGKSALDIATDATNYAKQVTLLFRESHWPIPVDVLNLIDVRRIFFNRLVLGFLPLYQRPGKYAQMLHRYGSWAVKGFWRFVELLLRIQYPLVSTETLPNDPVEKDIFNHDFLPRTETYPLLRNGKIRGKKGTIREFYEKGIVLDNGDRIECDSVILGTGWQQNFDFLPDKFKDSVNEDGVYLYRHVLHPDLNNLAFIGWASTFSNSLTSHLAAVWLVHVLQRTVKLPDKQAVSQEIEEMKQWKRGFIPTKNGRGALLQLHMWNYHDELLQDANINPRRKTNWFAEWLQDYRPGDYKDVLTGVSRIKDNS